MNISIGQADPVWVAPLVNFFAVLLGAGLTWFTTRHFELVNRKDRDLANAFALVFKVQFFADEIWKINREINTSISLAEQQGFQGPLWTKLRDIIGLEESPERITAEELALVARTKDVAFLTKIRELESGHGILKQSISKIQKLRAALASSGLAKSAAGRVVSFESPPERAAEFAPLFISLNDLSNGLEEMSKRVAENASEVAVKIGDHLKLHYKFGRFVSLAIPEDI